jgi:hypothetical protein
MAIMRILDSDEKLAEQMATINNELAPVAPSESPAQAEIPAHNRVLEQTQNHPFRQTAEKAGSSIDSQTASTHNLITIHDIFAEYTLTDGQAELVRRLEQFLSNKTESVFLLKGYAGTGKTFITKGLTEYFRAIGRNYVLAAPTGKASKVIAVKTNSPAYTIHKTIYSFEDIVEYRDDEVEGTETFKYYAMLAANERSADTVYIVDEASMIPDIYQESEFFRFGTGYLLTDFFKFVNLDHNDHRKKVIFIGDDAQLPPVGMNFSPALNSAYLVDEHGVSASDFELTEVVRQKTGSGVIQNAIELRKALQSGVFNQLDVDFNFPDVAKVEYQDLMSRYIESCGNKINGESIVIAYSNSDVADFNRRIREHFFPGCGEVVAGDKVMTVINSHAGENFISNGDFGLIRQVLGGPETRTISLKRKALNSSKVEEILIPLVFRKVEIGFRNLEGVAYFFQTMILEELLYSNKPVLSSDQNKALYLDFCIRHQTVQRKSVEFKQLLKSDPYFNALRLKFGYAITCHKAQGSEWNHVFVKCKSHQNQLTADYFRWFYTSITRTAKKLYLLDPPHLKLGAGLKLVQNPGIGASFQNLPLSPDLTMTSAVSEVQRALVSDVQMGELETFGIPESAPFLMALLKTVRDLVHGKGIAIDNVVHNQYKEVYFFSRAGEFTRVDLDYNSKSKVRGLRLHPPSHFGAELECILAPLLALPVSAGSAESINERKFAKPFLNEFHQRVCGLCAQSGMTVHSVAEQQWSQRYTFTRDGQTAVYDIWYNAKDQFGSCQPIATACSPGALTCDVGALLLAGLSA